MARSRLLTVRANQEAMERLALAAQIQGETMSEFVRRAVSERIRVVESSVEPEPVAQIVASDLCRHGLANCRICYPRTEQP